MSPTPFHQAGRRVARRRPYLHALVHQGEDVATGDQLLDGAAQAFGQAAEEIQSHDHEVLVGGFVLVRLRLVKLGDVRKEGNV